jgi:hypothetical protein
VANKSRRLEMIDTIKAKIDRRLYELTFCDAADLDTVNTITTSSTASTQNAHHIHLVSGRFDGQKIEGKNADGNNIHLPAKYIIDIN